jgi:hypothetical protein
MEPRVIRLAILSEQKKLEQRQLRASLANVGDRDALLANPDAIELAVDQIAKGGVCLLSHGCNVAELEERYSNTAPESPESKGLGISTSSAIRTRRVSTWCLALRCSERQIPSSGQVC